MGKYDIIKDRLALKYQPSQRKPVKKFEGVSTLDRRKYASNYKIPYVLKLETSITKPNGHV